MSGLVVFDCDGCVVGAGHKPRPGVDLMLSVTAALGFDVHLWSKAGEAHAQMVGRLFGVSAGRCHTKPVHSLAASEAACTLGGVPALCVDNDGRHVPPGWPALILDSWWG